MDQISGAADSHSATARENRLVRLMCYFMRRRLDPIR
jgi:hypothetical protein